MPMAALLPELDFRAAGQVHESSPATAPRFARCTVDG